MKIALSMNSRHKQIAPVIILSIIFTVAIILSCTREKTSTERTNKASLPSGPIIDDSAGESPQAYIEAFGNDPKALARLGDKHFESGKFKEAIEVYEKVLKLDPKDVDTYNDLGLAYHYDGKPDIAIRKLREGTEVMPGYQRIWISLGYVLLATGRAEEARGPLKRAVEMNPDSAVGKEAKRMLESIR